MATFTLTSYTPGVDVDVYARSDFPVVPATPAAAPSGPTAVFSGTMGSDGTLAVTGLDDETEYLAYGDSRYVRFKTPAATVYDGPGVEIVDSNGDPVVGKHLKVALDALGAVDTTTVVDN